MKAIIGATALAGTVGIGGGYYVNLPKFGAKPQGRRLERVLASPHWNGTEFDLPPTGIHVVWFGHSSFFLQINGKKILVDPVFSTYASSVPFIVKAFDGTDIYSPDDIPDLDVLLISHDHWDHLDYPTVTALQKRIKKVVCPLRVDGHLISWGFSEEQVQELD